MCCAGDQDQCLCVAGCGCNCCAGCGGEDLDATLAALVDDPEYDEALRSMVAAVVDDETLHALARSPDDDDEEGPDSPAVP